MMPKYKFKNIDNYKEIEISCSMSQIKAETKRLKKLGYERIFDFGLIGFDDIGRSK